MVSKPLSTPLSTFDEVDAQDKSLQLPHFSSDDAFEIGVLIRDRIREVSIKPAVIEISLANSNQILFRAISRPGIIADNDNRIRRKRNTVLRFGWSTWAAHLLFDRGDEAKFKSTFAIGDAAECSINGGGFPIRVKGVEGVIGAIVVGGLTMEEDHQTIVESLQKFLSRCG